MILSASSVTATLFLSSKATSNINYYDMQTEKSEFKYQVQI